jgi:putative ABC transport system substrate-binding protein
MAGSTEWAFAARAQRPAMPVVGFLSSRSPNESASAVAAFRESLGEAGYIEGKNLAIAFGWADWSIRSATRPGGRSGSPSGSRDFRNGW